MAKFRGVRKFFKSAASKVEDYVSIDLNLALSDLFTGLTKLSFPQNFDGELVTIELTASLEVAIPHSLKSIPSGKIVLRDYGNTIVDGATVWTSDTIYVQNNTATTITATIMILR